MCSNNETLELKNCSTFKTKHQFQDSTCFTFNDSTLESNSQFQFLLNLKNMAQDQPLQVKLFIHEPGTIPDALETETTGQDIHQDQEITEVLIKGTSHEYTNSFEQMNIEKRHCLLQNESIGYDRINCLNQKIHQYAEKVCHCIPRLLKKSETLKICNFTGLLCFRKAILQGMTESWASKCPIKCSYMQYQVRDKVKTWDDPMIYGEECSNFVANNPTSMFLINETKELLVGGYAQYMKQNMKQYSLVKVSFESPQVTKITKDAKVTVPDMVSNIGGTLGIFLGLSTISILDQIIDWMKGLNDVLRGKKAPPKILKHF